MRYNFAPVTADTYVDAILTDAADELAYATSIRPSGRFGFFRKTTAAAAVVVAAVVVAPDATAADPIPGGARDVVAISPAPAGPAVTVYLSNGAADILKPCRYEDGRQCYWDASERGNGIGHDVVTTRGRVHHVDIAAMLRTWRELN